MRIAGPSMLLMGALLLTACSEPPEPVYQTSPSAEDTIQTYDATLEPSAAVLALVPTEATSVSVTDFEQLRLTLGFAELDSAADAGEIARFDAALADSPALSGGLLAGVDARLRSDFGFGADDVSWEASYTGPDGAGWVVAFVDDVGMDSVQRAVRAGVGPLAGAVVDADRHLVSGQELPAAEDSWGADPDLVALSGRVAGATYLSRGCLGFDQVFGAGMEADLAAAPRDALDALDPLDGFAVALGSELATVQLGPSRPDSFDRARLADVMPRTTPEFGRAFDRAVADPSTGRVGYDLTRPDLAAELVNAGRLPFAVCAD